MASLPVSTGSTKSQSSTTSQLSGHLPESNKQLSLQAYWGRSKAQGMGVQPAADFEGAQAGQLFPATQAQQPPCHLAHFCNPFL